MKFALLRHFKVNHPYPKKLLLSKAEVIGWFEEYDSSDKLHYTDVNLLGMEWKRCYTSTMVRAVRTAGHVFKGEIVQLPELRELSILHRLPGRVRLPFLVWGILVKLQSMGGNEDMKAFEKRIAAVVDRLMKEEDVLVVSHLFVMQALRKELLRRGLKGEKFGSREYGRVYVYDDRPRTTDHRPLR